MMDTKSLQSQPRVRFPPLNQSASDNAPLDITESCNKKQCDREYKTYRKREDPATVNKAPSVKERPVHVIEKDSGHIQEHKCQR
jgi:hypothetical protein